MKKVSLLLKEGSFIKSKYKRLLMASILGWIVCLIDGCADTFFAGAFLNEAAVSGISLITPIASIISFLSYLVSAGTALMYSREAGAFNKERANRLAGQGLICSLIVSVFLVISMFLLEDPVIAFYSPSAEIEGYARDYYLCQIAFAGIYPIYYLLCQMVCIDGDDAISFLACLGAAAGNIVSSVLMVESLGVKGLALGSAVGAFAGILVYLFHFLRKTNSIRFRFQFVLYDIWEMVKLSSTTSLTLLYVAVIDIIMNKFIISVYSDIYLPAYAVINLILNIGAVFASSYEAASGFICVGYGEKNPESIRRTMKISVRFNLIESAFAFVIIEAAASGIPNLFGICSPEVAEASVFAARIIAFSFPAMALYYLLCSYYPATGKIIMGNIITAIYMLILPLVLAIPLGLVFGFKGMATGFMLTAFLSIAAVAVIISLRYGKRAFPLILEKTEEDSLSYDLYLNEESITTLCSEIKNELSQRNISSTVSNEIQLIAEESYMTIKEKNKKENPKRKVLSECNILISNDTIRMITRDNGMIFDITDADAKVEDLRSYVLARLMEKNSDRTHVTTISFNRNSYYWKLDE